MGYAPGDLSELHVVSFPDMAALDTQRGGQELLACAKEYRADVVVVDTVSRTVEGEENANDTWLRFARYSVTPLKAAGVALLRLDHAGKDDSRGQRGGSAKSGDVDLVWRLSVIEEEKTFRLQAEKHRMPLGQDDLVLHREYDDDGRLHHRVAANPIRDAGEATLREAMATLDRLDVPVDIGRERVRDDYLKPFGIKISNNVLAKAIRDRKRLSVLSASEVADNTDSQVSVRDSPGQSPAAVNG